MGRLKKPKKFIKRLRGGIGMGNTCKPMAVSFQCMTKFTTNKKKLKKKKRERLPATRLKELGRPFTKVLILISKPVLEQLL